MIVSYHNTRNCYTCVNIVLSDDYSSAHARYVSLNTQFHRNDDHVHPHCMPQTTDFRDHN